jgi:hypothetical protein
VAWHVGADYRFTLLANAFESDNFYQIPWSRIEGEQVICAVL